MKRTRLGKTGSNQYRTKYKGLKAGTWLSVTYLILFLALGLSINFYYEERIKEETKFPQIISPVPVEYKVTTGEEEVIEASREAKLKSFLEKHNSPLSEYAEYMVKMADEHDVSWTLVASIAGKESSFGKAIKPNSHNAWGIMTWNNKGDRSIRTFSSWTEGIEYATKLLANNYREDMNSAIQARYCPSFECSDTWVKTVTAFQEEIN